jgi:ADP-heptose:LPS heptosyltransferase
VSNDTGGMHLANALGVPLVALFGPTNPVRTGPVFDAPFIILQPPGCPPTGGGALPGLLPGTVARAVGNLPLRA